jgi:hypothetical protein
MMDADEEAQFSQWFRQGFRQLYLDDILRANAGDVRMRTFILCAAFLDALSLSYSAGRKPRDKAVKWARFMEDYLGERYEPIWGSYDSYRNMLLHNYSPRGIAFASAPEHAGLHLRVVDGNVMLHRESFVHDVEKAFEAFAQDVRIDVELRKRVFAHLERYPPLGLAVILLADLES